MTEGGADIPNRGLSSREVDDRKQRGQINRTAGRSGRSYRRIAFDNAFAPVNIVLYVISGVLIFAGLPADALFTTGLVLVNVVIGAVQETRAKRRLDEISLLAQATATVVRDGEEQSIAPSEIVMDDVVLVRQGDELHVDGIVLRENGLSVDESLLTGESEDVRKRPGDRAFSGSYCTAGSGAYQADRVGDESTAQQITTRARRFQMVQTPLQREVSVVILAMAGVVAVLAISVLNAFVRLYGSVPLEETARAAAVIVALVPQGLVFMITVSYAKAAVRIANNGALVQRLNAVESMSHVDVLCVDKTGTLTSNSLSLDEIEAVGVDEAEAQRLLAEFAASSTTRNRTSSAIAEAFPAQPRPVRFEVPFDSTRKWSAVGFADGVFSVLGAPEVLQAKLRDASDLDERLAPRLERGLRVLVFACLPDGPSTAPDELPDGLQLRALVVIKDELRPEAAETVARFAASQIELRVLSGDHPDAVAALARQVGIKVEGDGISGSEVDAMDDAALAKAVRETAVFGRISPDHKERIIDALRDQGHTVAMVGDGVNDIPALKRANVSLAMLAGSPATRGIADIVLLNDSFSVLPAAFTEGQRIRAGMASVLRIFLVRTLALSLVILGASLLADAFPTTPRQAGIPALLTVGLPAIALVFLAKPDRTERYLLPQSLAFIMPAALTSGLVCLAVYHGFLLSTDDVAEARTALLLQQVFCGLVLLPYVRRDSQRAGLHDPDGVLVLLAGAMLVIALPGLAIAPLREVFEVSSLSPEGYLATIAATVAWCLVLHLTWRFGPDPSPALLRLAARFRPGSASGDT